MLRLPIVILACGQEDIRHGRKRWILWGVALGLVVAAIILDFSRAGIAILVAGSALWLGMFSICCQRSPSRIALVFSFLLILSTALLIFGGQTLERFHLQNLANAGISCQSRDFLVTSSSRRMMSLNSSSFFRFT